VMPLLPVLEFQRGYCGITEQDAPRAARDKIAGRMLLLEETLAEGSDHVRFPRRSRSRAALSSSRS
jgi:hypothetical protein